MNKNRCQEVIAGQLVEVWYIFDSGSKYQSGHYLVFGHFSEQVGHWCIFHLLHSVACNKRRVMDLQYFLKGLVFWRFFFFVPFNFYIWIWVFFSSGCLKIFICTPSVLWRRVIPSSLQSKCIKLPTRPVQIWLCCSFVVQ